MRESIFNLLDCAGTLQLNSRSRGLSVNQVTWTKEMPKAHLSPLPTAASCSTDGTRADRASASIATGLRVELLGHFAVILDGAALGGDVWRRTHARQLVQFVGSHRRGSAARSDILAALWPNLDGAHARNRLHHTLHLIRKAIEALPDKVALVGMEGEAVALGSGVAVDVADFLRYLDCDGEDSERLAALLAAIDLYKGDLAADWTGDHTIESRRVALRRKYLAALAEAAALCRNNEDFEQAIVLLQRRVQADPTDSEAHVEYAQALFDAGRCDAAVDHCRRARLMLADADHATSAQPLDDLLKSLQQKANRIGAQGAPAASMMIAPPAGSKLLVDAPPRRLYGRDAVIRAAFHQIEDPYCSLVTLCGPPGSGRTSVALQVATRLQSRMRDGAVHVVCGAARSAEAVLAALARALAPLGAEGIDSVDALARLLRRRELLIVLDDVFSADDIARMISQLSQAARDCRFLVCAVRRLRLAGERVVPINFLPLASTPLPGSKAAPAAAVEFLLDHVHTRAPTQRIDERYICGLTQIAALVDGWPLALTVTAQWLAWMQPAEVAQRLKTWHSATDDCDEPLERALNEWVGAAAECTPVLLEAAIFESWFTRADLSALLEGPPRPTLDRFFDITIDTHLLTRRARAIAGREISEYRVPLLVRNRLRQRTSPSDWQAMQRRHVGWLQISLSGDPLDSTLTPVAHAALLIDTYRDDIAAATRFLADSGEPTALLRMVTALLPGMRIGGRPETSLDWVSLALKCSSGAADAQAGLYVARALLHVRLGNPSQAFQDAGAAYRAACDHGAEPIRRHALEMLQILGRETGQPAVLVPAPPRGQPLLTRGVEAGENLLRVAGLAARFGEFAKAADLSAKAVEVFRYFGCPLGEVRALRYHGRMAFALGNLQQVQAVAQTACRVAEERALKAEAARASLMLAEVELAQQEFAPAIRSACHILGTATCADLAVEARAFKVLAWGHYFDGQLALAEVMQRELAHRADALGDPGHIANSHLLRALLSCDGRDPERARTAVALLHAVLVASPGPVDMQSAFSEVAYLAGRFHRPATAGGLLCSLSEFARQPGHQLRPLTRARVEGIEVMLHSQAGARAEEASARTVQDALADLLDA